VACLSNKWPVQVRLVYADRQTIFRVFDMLSAGTDKDN
jgi:hypothetical protein